MSYYVIQTGCHYVAGYSSAHGIVQRTSMVSTAKRFRSSSLAYKFINTHGDAGRGLVTATCQVVEVEA